MTNPASGTLSASEFTGFPVDALDAALDDAWSTRSLATDKACRIYAARILAAVQQHVPDAVRVILREDTSHLPPHGHVDAIVTATGEDAMLRLGEWHDLDWAGAVDEDVWDVYHLAPHLFVRDSEDHIRRLTLIATDVPPGDTTDT